MFIFVVRRERVSGALLSLILSPQGFIPSPLQAVLAILAQGLPEEPDRAVTVSYTRITVSLGSSSQHAESSDESSEFLLGKKFFLPVLVGISLFWGESKTPSVHSLFLFTVSKLCLCY